MTLTMYRRLWGKVIAALSYSLMDMSSARLLGNPQHLGNKICHMQFLLHLPMKTVSGL